MSPEAHHKSRPSAGSYAITLSSPVIAIMLFHIAIIK